MVNSYPGDFRQAEDRHFLFPVRKKKTTGVLVYRLHRNIFRYILVESMYYKLGRLSWVGGSSGQTGYGSLDGVPV